MEVKHHPLKPWQALLLGTVMTSLGVLDLLTPRRAPDGVMLADGGLTFFLIGVGLSLLAGILLKPKSKNPLEGQKPTTLTQRGSFTNWLIGRRQLQPIFAWAGDRQVKKEKSGGGKGGGSSSKVDIFYEAGWHILASNGPFDCLHRIVQRGEVIWKGPITRDSHPSGSTIALGKEGTFRIFWGEPNQPVNNFLGASSRVGVSSRWPHMLYIEWVEKRLGTSANWPVLEYECEKRPTTTILTQSEGYKPPTETLTGPTRDIFAFQNGGEGVGYFELVGSYVGNFPPKGAFELSGNAMPDGRYEIFKSQTVQITIGMFTQETRTRVFPVGGVTGADANGQMQAYEFLPDDGVNPAHAIAELLFAQWPEGLSKDPTETGSPEPIDLASLEEMGVRAEAEGIVFSVFIPQGESVKATIGTILQDMGYLWTVNTDTGRLTFVPIREPSGTLPNVSIDMQPGGLPEIRKKRAELKADTLVFSFADRERNYNDMTVGVDEDGQASIVEYKNARTVGIPNVINFDVAGIVAERRSQEELSKGGRFTLKTNRDTRSLIPGQAIVAEGFNDLLRVVEVKIDPIDEEVELVCIPDSFGVEASGFETGNGGGQEPDAITEPDLIFEFAEVPSYLLSASDPMTIVVPRVRGNNQIVSADIHLSRDNISYILQGSELGTATGGLLDVALTDADPWLALTGPTITLLGPDAALALDLTADPTNWKLGRQLALISSSAGIEVCYLRNIVALGGDTYRLDGLIRGRYDTTKLNHPAGAEVYIFELTDLTTFQDLLLVPDEDLYVKSQPLGPSGQLPLSAVSPAARVLNGKNVRPMMPGALRVVEPHYSNAYTTGADVRLRWNYRSAIVPKTAAGLQSGGTATPISPSPGAFTVEIRTVGGVLVASHGVPQTTGVVEFLYTNAQLVADLGSEVSFRARVFVTGNGLDSAFDEILVVKI